MEKASEKIQEFYFLYTFQIYLETVNQTKESTAFEVKFWFVQDWRDNSKWAKLLNESTFSRKTEIVSNSKSSIL